MVNFDEKILQFFEEQFRCNRMITTLHECYYNNKGEKSSAKYGIKRSLKRIQKSLKASMEDLFQ